LFGGCAILGFIRVDSDFVRANLSSGVLALFNIEGTQLPEIMATRKYKAIWVDTAIFRLTLISLL
jgi:hypothetical protein